MKKEIIFLGEQVVVSCDENCNKAWGRSTRPRLLKEDDEWGFIPDEELDDAPVDPGTREGGQAKPTSKEQIPNKWCVRECERCKMKLK